MSFGFSISDFIAVGELALRVYRAYRDAPEQFAAISTEVGSLHLILKEVECTWKEQLPTEKEREFEQIVNGCKSVLGDLEKLLRKYKTIGKKTRWTWDRLKWHQDDIVELRLRVISHVGLLQSFNSSLTR